MRFRDSSGGANSITLFPSGEAATSAAPRNIRNKRPSRREPARAGSDSNTLPTSESAQETRTTAPFSGVAQKLRRELANVAPQRFLFVRLPTPAHAPTRANNGPAPPGCRRPGSPADSPPADLIMSIAGGCSRLFKTWSRAAIASATASNSCTNVRVAGGHRMQPEIHHRDRRQRAERSDHELGHVQTRHVLHHHAAGPDQLAFERREGHADHHVARGAIQPAPRTADVGRHDSADGGAARKTADRAGPFAGARPRRELSSNRKCPPRR